MITPSTTVRCLWLAAALAGGPWRLYAAPANPPAWPLWGDLCASLEYPVLKLFLFLAVVALLSVALLRRRHRSELLAVCLALSITLHLLSLSLFSVLPVGSGKSAIAVKSSRHRIEIGAPSLREAQVRNNLRADPLVSEILRPPTPLEPERLAWNEPRRELPTKITPLAPEPEIRSEPRGEIKNPEPGQLPKPIDESLTAMPNRPLDPAAVKIAMAPAVSPKPQAEPARPETPKPFEAPPNALAAQPIPERTPEAPPLGLQDPQRTPARAPITLPTPETRQPEVKDAMRPAAAATGTENLDVRAQLIAEGRLPGQAPTVPAAGPNAVQLTKLAGNEPAVGAQRIPAVSEPAAQPRMATESIAAASPDNRAPKRGLTEEIKPSHAANVTKPDPLPLNGSQPLLVAARPEGPGEKSPGQGEWKTAREKLPEIQSAPLAPGVKPDGARAGLPDTARLPERNPVALAAPGTRQPEVAEAMRPVEAATGPERLEVRAKVAEDGRGFGQGASGVAAGPGAAVQLDKQAGGAPPTVEHRIKAVTKTAGQPRMAVESVAADNPDALERKQNEVGWIAPDTAPDAARLEPVRLSGLLPLATAARAGPPGQAATQLAEGKTELAPTRNKIATPGIGQLALDKPQTGMADAAPSKEPIRIGLGGESFAEPTAKAPTVQDLVSDMPAGRPGLQSIGNPAPRMPLEQAHQGAGRSSPVDKPEPSDLAAVKQGTGIGSGPVMVTGSRIAPTDRIGHQVGEPRLGTLVAGTGGGLEPRASGSAEVITQLVGLPAGSGPAGLTDMGLPAQTAPTVARGTSSGTGSGVGYAALTPGKLQPGGLPAAGGGVERPAPTGRSDLPAGRGSLVVAGNDQGASRAVGSAFAGDSQIETGTGPALGSGAIKGLAGRMSIENSAGAGSQPADTIQIDLAVGKVNGGTATAFAPGRVKAPSGGGGGGQASTPSAPMVLAGDFQAPGRAPTAGTVKGELAPAGSASAGTSAAGGPALTAPTVGRTGGPAGSPAGQAGLPPAALHLAKVSGADPLQLGGRSEAGLKVLPAPANIGGKQDPSRIEMSLSEGPAKALISTDISAAPAGQPVRRSFLPVGTAPKPDSVPEKAIYQMRKPEKRKQFIRELGGTPQSEEAVEQALNWLHRTQSDDGRWDVDGFKTVGECGGPGDLANEDVAVTGLALLAYLGAGYTHLEYEHQETVRKALDWLLNCELDNGDIRGTGQMYGQAIATAALCESYSLTGDARLLEPAQRAVRFIVDAQTPESGWRYEPHRDSDTSVTGWQILALKSAQIAGIAVPKQTIAWTEHWLDQVRQGAEGGLYSYKPGHAVTPVMTAEGAFCQLFMEEQVRSKGQAESTAYIMQNLPAWDPEKRRVHLYYWYYATLALHLAGAPEFDAWNAALCKALLDGRRTSGAAAGSWDPVCHLGPRGGRIYSTAMAALCLEVYYRFLPLYKRK